MSDQVCGEDLIYVDKAELRNLGITVMGDRHALVKEITRLSEQGGEVAEPAIAPEGAKVTDEGK